MSQIVRGDKEKQVSFCRSIGLRHLQLTHAAGGPAEEEPSQRARSFIFLALGVLAATTLKIYGEGGTVPFYVCENGFIAINPPLTGGRIGSLSTRTAHPEFLTRFQQILDTADLKVQIENPYAFSTKGEMMKACKNQSTLRNFAVTSTSCGRFLHYNYKHCGRCVPCQVRRASFLASGVEDSTEYVFRDLGKDDEDHAGFDDVRSAAMAIAERKQVGLERWLGAALSYPHVGDVSKVEALVDRGLKELEALHLSHGVK